MGMPVAFVDTNIDWIAALPDYVTVRVPLCDRPIMKDKAHATTQGESGYLLMALPDSQVFVVVIEYEEPSQTSKKTDVRWMLWVASAQHIRVEVSVSRRTDRTFA